MLIDLIFIANEMKNAARHYSLDAEELKKIFLESGKMPAFPEKLRRQYNGFQFQFSLDKLQNKVLMHLSYSKLDNSNPTSEEQKEIEIAFFGKKENLLRFPGIHCHIHHVGFLTDGNY